MWSPEAPLIIEITPTIRLLLWLGAATFTGLLSLLGWLAVRLWRGARTFEQAAQQIAAVPRLMTAVFGSTDEDPPRPGALRRLASAEERVTAIWDLLGLSDPEAKREAVRRKLLGDVTEDTGQHRSVSHIVARHPTPYRMPIPREDEDEGTGRKR